MIPATHAVESSDLRKPRASGDDPGSYYFGFLLDK